MDKWNSQLEDFHSLLTQIAKMFEENKGNFRFKNPFIKASDIAQQYFCEKKVEMEYLHGRIETESKILGAEAHEKLLADSVTIKRKELWQEIYGEKPILALEMLLLARYKDVILAGRPDSVLFQKGYPLIVFEYKFSKSEIPYSSYHIQAKTYGVILKSMGFDTGRLFYAIVIANPKAQKDKELKRRVVEAVLKNGPKENVLKTRNAGIHFHKFNQNEAEKDLDWAIEFWKKKRNAISTTNPNKCRNCEYNEKCNSLSVG